MDILILNTYPARSSLFHDNGTACSVNIYHTKRSNQLLRSGTLYVVMDISHYIIG